MRLFYAPTRKADAASTLGSLRRDTGGNVLAMSAAALIPLLAMIGGAIDASRLYMARTRLQQACDAGALAGRKAMSSVQALTDSEKAKATEFFDFNFPSNTYSAQNIVRTYARGDIGVVVGDASIDMPTTIMKFFGFTTVKMEVACQSTLNIPNTDVMFVLDVTGSMLETPSGDTVTKIDGLRQGVKDFFAALGAGAASGPGRIRYGFVPYSSNVNVGKIVYSFNPAYIAGGNGTEQWTYHSRTAQTTTERVATYGTESTPAESSSSSTATTWSGYTNDTSYSNMTLAQCQAKVDERPDTDKVTSTSTTTTSETPPTYPNTTRQRTYTTTEQHELFDSGAQYNSSTKTCQTRHRTGTYTKTIQSSSSNTATWTERQKFAGWTFGPRSIDVSPFVQSASGSNPAYYTGYWADTDPNVNNGVATPTSVTWNGCIEEASTDNTITATSSLSIPSGANDLNIDLIPSSTQTRWKPYLPGVQYDANGNWLNRQGWINAGRSACPREASRLTMYASDYVAASKSSSSFNAYVDSLTAVGGTYHDIGLIWGARFLSQDGIFAADNRDAASPGAYQVSRHIVFMTDGFLDTKPDSNDPWGITSLEGRIAPKTTDELQLEAIHNRRTSMICNAMKGKGFTIWVVGYGISSMPQELQDCATDADHWSLASNATTLKTRFQAIAQTIGGLRLSQ